MRDRLEPMRAPWFVVVLTLPSELWSLSLEQLRELRSRGARVVSRWLLRCAGVSGSSWSVGFGEFTHPAGDDATWKPHYNFLGPLLAVQMKGDVREVLVLRVKRSKAELRALRVAWRAEIRAVTGWDTSDVDVHYEYRTTRAKKRHAARYFARPFPDWHWTKLNRVRWYGFLSARTWGKTREFLVGIGAADVLEDAPQGGPEEDGEIRCPECGAVMLLDYAFALAAVA